MQINPLLTSLSQVPALNAQTSTTTAGDNSTQHAAASAAAPTLPQTAQAPNQPQSGQSQHDGKHQEKDLQQAVDHLNDTAKLFNTQLQFAIDATTGKQVIKVTDSQTNEVIRQIPSEDALRLSKALNDFKGLLVKDSA